MKVRTNFKAGGKSDDGTSAATGAKAPPKKRGHEDRKAWNMNKQQMQMFYKAFHTENPHFKPAPPQPPGTT